MGLHDGHRQRLKEEFAAHPESFPDHRLLELLLFYVMPRRDTNELAHILLERFDTLTGILDTLPVELCKVDGIGDSTVIYLKALKELCRRDAMERRSEHVDTIIHRARDAKQLLEPCFYGARKEKSYVLCMDAKGKSLGVRLISEGSVDATSLTARSVMEASLSLNASQVILAHNHPSGIALPSDQDKAITAHLYAVLDTVNIKLVDHLIFADGDMVSMRESGIWHALNIGR